MISCSFRPTQGFCPVHISHSRMPKAYTSPACAIATKYQTSRAECQKGQTSAACASQHCISLAEGHMHTHVLPAPLQHGHSLAERNGNRHRPFTATQHQSPQAEGQGHRHLLPVHYNIVSVSHSKTPVYLHWLPVHQYIASVSQSRTPKGTHIGCLCHCNMASAVQCMLAAGGCRLPPYESVVRGIGRVQQPLKPAMVTCCAMFGGRKLGQQQWHGTVVSM